MINISSIKGQAGNCQGGRLFCPAPPTDQCLTVAARIDDNDRRWNAPTTCLHAPEEVNSAERKRTHDPSPRRPDSGGRRFAGQLHRWRAPPSHGSWLLLPLCHRCFHRGLQWLQLCLAPGGAQSDREYPIRGGSPLHELSTAAAFRRALRDEVYLRYAAKPPGSF